MYFASMAKGQVTLVKIVEDILFCEKERDVFKSLEIEAIGAAVV